MRPALARPRSSAVASQRLLQRRAVFAGLVLAGDDQVVAPARVVEHRAGLGRAQPVDRGAQQGIGACTTKRQIDDAGTIARGDIQRTGDIVIRMAAPAICGHIRATARRVCAQRKQRGVYGNAVRVGIVLGAQKNSGNRCAMAIFIRHATCTSNVSRRRAQLAAELCQ